MDVCKVLNESWGLWGSKFEETLVYLFSLKTKMKKRGRPEKSSSRKKIQNLILSEKERDKNLANHRISKCQEIDLGSEGSKYMGSALISWGKKLRRARNHLASEN